MAIFKTWLAQILCVLAWPLVLRCAKPNWRVMRLVVSITSTARFLICDRSMCAVGPEMLTAAMVSSSRPVIVCGGTAKNLFGRATDRMLVCRSANPPSDTNVGPKR